GDNRARRRQVVTVRFVGDCADDWRRTRSTRRGALKSGEGTGELGDAYDRVRSVTCLDGCAETAELGEIRSGGICRGDDPAQARPQVGQQSHPRLEFLDGSGGWGRADAVGEDTGQICTGESGGPGSRFVD